MRKMTKQEMILEQGRKLADEVRRTGIHPEVEVIETRPHTVGIICPYCRRTHWHGRESRGHLESHCFEFGLNFPPGYIIVDKINKAKARAKA